MLIGIVILGAVSGCGSSRPKGVNFHSASRHYTVREVESAFAAQGIPLQKDAKQPIPGSILLRGGHRPHLVSALVRVSGANGTYFVFLGVRSNSDRRTTRHGNVAASFDPTNAEGVKAAFARLH